MTSMPVGMDHTHLTVVYTDGGPGEDDWVTAQIVEYPAAISQGPNRRAAFLNVIDALHDLLKALPRMVR